MQTWLSRHIFHPLWEIKDRGIKLKTVRQLERSQWLPADRLRELQWGRLREMLKYAYENCEFYSSQFRRARIRPEDIRGPEDLAGIPVLCKGHIRHQTDELISRRYRKDDLVMSRTGGSTGRSLLVFCDNGCRDMRNAAAIRSDRWAGWDIGDVRAAIWGNPPIAKTLRNRLRSALLDRIIYLDTMRMDEREMKNFISLYRRHRPSVMFGHSHSIYILARFVLAKGIDDIRPLGIISTSMMLLQHERTTIENAFGCKVNDRYGCEEVGLIASQCDKHDGMHLNTDHLYVEFISDDGSPAKQGEHGSIVVTDLINRGMPLVRYRVEDVGVPGDRMCSCGRGLPIMEEVTGRTADFLVRRDGSLVAGVSLIERTLTAIEGIEQMQIVQEAVDSIIIRVVRDGRYDQESERRLQAEFKNVFGANADIILEYVEGIPQETSGKFRFSICKVKNPLVN